MGMKALVNNEKLWYSEVRSAVTDAFETIDSADDGTISIAELCEWLEDEDGILPSRREASNYQGYSVEGHSHYGHIAA